MFKNVRKLLFIAIFAVVSAFAFACTPDEVCEKCEECTKCAECGKEVSADNCKDYFPEVNADLCKDVCVNPSSETCKEYCTNPSKETCTEFCDECTDPNKENCKDFCDPAANTDNCKEYCPTVDKELCKDVCTDPNAENCKEFCQVCTDPNKENCKEFCDVCPEVPFVAPTAFDAYGASVKVGQKEPVFVDEESFEPIGDNTFKGLLFSSSDESIATVDAEGNVYGVTPGVVEITVTSMLDATVSQTVEFVVDDPLDTEYDVLQREKALIASKLPQLASENFAFPTPWNPNVEMTVTDESGNAITEFAIPADLESEKGVSLTFAFKYRETTDTLTVTIYAVKSASDNSVTRIAQVQDCIATLLKEYTDGKLVDTDITLPTQIYGVTLAWSSTNSAVLTSEGVYTRPVDDKAVTLELVAKYLSNSASPKYNVVCKGYSADEKVDYILNEGTLANVNGKSFNTSLVLPAHDGKFETELSYKSSNTEIFADNGALVAAPAEATEVEFDVTIKYAVSKSNNFEQTVKIKVTALPANTASAAAEEWLQASSYKEVTQFAWGKVAGNVLDVPTTYTKGEATYDVKWDVSKAVVAPKYLRAEEVKTTNAFELVEGKPQLVVQYLRYQEAQVQATFVNTADPTDTATINVVLNIGASADPTYIHAGTWESGDQGDGTLTPRQGAYDLTDNASHFDSPVGLTQRVYGWGFWSGVKITSAEYNGETYEAFIMDYMYWEVQNDGEGIKVNDLSLLNNGGDMGGNWGWLMHNASDKDIMLEVGTYSTEGALYGDGTALASSVGSRASHAMDGYAIGFVADKDGNVTIGSGDGFGETNQGRLQYHMNNDRVVVGSEEAKYFVGDSDAGSEVNYVIVPAGGYAMSWKYQFYGQGNALSLNAFNQTGSKLTIEKYDVHPLNSQFAEYAVEALESAESSIAEGAKGVTVESYVNRARKYYDQLSDATKLAVFDVARLEATELACAKLLDAEVLALLADDKAGEDEYSDSEGFVVTLATLFNRFKANSSYITALMEQKAAFDACYLKYSKVDLTVTLDYDGGFATGVYGFDDYNKVIPDVLSDLYDWFIEQDAFHKVVNKDTGEMTEDLTLTVPTREEFTNKNYFTQWAVYGYTVLSKYLFTPYMEADGTTINENYMDVIEGTDKFFNSEKYHKWIDIMDLVDEASRQGNMGGQDAWGRAGTISAPAKWSDAELVKYGGNDVTITNKGVVIGAYRFAQYINGTIGSTVYKNKIPANIYFATFDRQDTQEKYSRITYHCTDLAVELPLAPYKEGYNFNGWYFDDGTPAVITGSLFKDVTVRAQWVPKYEEYVEEQTSQKLDVVYYGLGGEDHDFRKSIATGTLSDQITSVGLGKYAIAVEGKMFIFPAKALIELGKDYTEDKTLATKEEVQPYGTDGYDQNSTGLLLQADGTVKANNSYGHGALYQNAGQFNVTIANVDLAYGRAFAGADYGYNKYHFSYDTEKQAYVGTLVAAAAQVVLKPGDFLWCPMTADRYCSGLTDCNGTSGNKGCLFDGVTAQFVDISGVVAPEQEWYGAVFMDGKDYVYEFYLNAGESFEKPADLAKSGYDFKGWATKADALPADAVEVVTTPTESVTYYAIWEKVERFAEVTVEAGYTGTDLQTYTTFATALNHILEGAVITVKPGLYEGDAVIDRACTIKGPDAKFIGTEQDTAETLVKATYSGKLTVAENVQNVKIEGMVFTGTGEKVTLSAGNKGISFTNCTFNVSGVRGIYSKAAISDIVIEGCVFNAPLAADARLVKLEGTVTNITFKRNVFASEEKANAGIYLDAFRCDNVAGVVNVIENNFNKFYGDNYSFFLGNGSNACTEINVIGNTLLGANADAANIYLCGFAIRRAGSDCVINVKYNEFSNCQGTFFSLNNSTAKVNMIGNAFMDSVWSNFVADYSGCTIVVDKNFFGGDVPTTITSTNAYATYADCKAARIAEYGVLSFDEAMEVYYKDFHSYSGTTDDLETFIGKIKANDTSAKIMYSANNKGVVDDALKTFVNSTAWATKYMPFMDAWDAMVKDVNPAQSAWTSAWTGYLRISGYLNAGTYKNAYRDQLIVDGLNAGLKALRDAAEIKNIKDNYTLVGTIQLECKDYSMWTPDYYNNLVYLTTGMKSGGSWLGAYLDDNGNGSFVVSGYKATGDAVVTSCAYSIIVFGDCPDYATVNALGITAGDIVIFSEDVAALASGVITTTASVYRAK